MARTTPSGDESVRRVPLTGIILLISVSSEKIQRVGKKRFTGSLRPAATGVAPAAPAPARSSPRTCSPSPCARFLRAGGGNGTAGTAPGCRAKFAALGRITARVMWGAGFGPALRSRCQSLGTGLVPPCAAGPGHIPHPQHLWLRLWGQPQARRRRGKAVNERGLYFWQQGHFFVAGTGAGRPRGFATPFRRRGAAGRPHRPQHRQQPRVSARTAAARRVAQYLLKHPLGCVFALYSRFSRTRGCVCVGGGLRPAAKPWPVPTARPSGVGGPRGG